MATTKLITAEDLLLMGDDEKRYELVNGEVVPVSPAGGDHSQIAVTIAFHIIGFAGPRKLGHTFGADGGFVLRRNPDTVRAPDVSFVTIDRLPDGPPIGFVPFAPDLAVEINSPSDRLDDVQNKVYGYLDAGVQMVWLVSPAMRTVTVYKDKQSPQIFHHDGTLTGEDVLPGFEVPVAQIFDPWASTDT